MSSPHIEFTLIYIHIIKHILYTVLGLFQFSLQIYSPLFSILLYGLVEEWQTKSIAKKFQISSGWNDQVKRKYFLYFVFLKKNCF